MAKKSIGLGKGIENIFGKDVTSFLDDIQNHASDVPGRKHMEINVEQIRPNPYQPRKEFNKQALEELAASIQEHGVFTPILVRQSIQGYELIAGERRLRASKIANQKTIPAIVVEFTDEQMMEISLLENVQREDLTAIEEAMAYDALIQKLGYTQEKLAKRVGKSREYCANLLRLLKLPKQVQDYVMDKKLMMGHVRPLLTLETEEQMVDLAKMILDKHMSVRQVENYVQQMKQPKVKKEQKRNPFIQDLQEKLSRKLDAQVKIERKKLIISYHDTHDLNRILEKLSLIEQAESEE